VGIRDCDVLVVTVKRATGVSWDDKIVMKLQVLQPDPVSTVSYLFVYF
jgi:hypothetical protein